MYIHTELIKLEVAGKRRWRKLHYNIILVMSNIKVHILLKVNKNFLQGSELDLETGTGGYNFCQLTYICIVELHACVHNTRNSSLLSQALYGVLVTYECNKTDKSTPCFWVQF